MIPYEQLDAVMVEVPIRAPARVVYAMFTDPSRLVQWIGIAATLEPRPGGLFRFELLPGEFCSGRYLELVPNSRLAFTWGWESGKLPLPPGSSTVIVELTEHEGVTTVRLTHRGLDAALRALHREGWERFLGRLTAAVEGTALPADPAAPYQDGQRDPLAG